MVGIRFSILIFMILLALSALGEVAAKDCPANEFYSTCGANCQTTCATLNQPCYWKAFKCIEACYCNAGYARDARGTCIPISQCKQ